MKESNFEKINKNNFFSSFRLGSSSSYESEKVFYLFLYFFILTIVLILMILFFFSKGKIFSFFSTN